jgi:hypothetical protein
MNSVSINFDQTSSYIMRNLSDCSGSEIKVATMGLKSSSDGGNMKCIQKYLENGHLEDLKGGR